MAGIGFELRRMIDQRDGFTAKVRAYACAGLISSGPWLMTILTLTLLNLAGPYLGDTEGYSLFRGLVTYAFAFSLVLTGIVQMAVTRRVADMLYSKQYHRVLPAFVASLAVTGGAHALLGLGFVLWARFDAALAFLAVSLFTIIGMTWIALIWLSIVRQYDDVLRAYVYGTLVAMVGVLLLFLSPGTTGILAAYTAGQAFTLLLLLRTIVRGMESEGGRELAIFKSVVRFPALVGVGLFYNAAIWVDKIVFWFVDGTGPHALVRYHPLYDTCSFLAYLTVVPALAINLVRLETSFYEKYRAYYGAILAGTPYSVISDRRRRMFDSLKEGIVQLLRIQGAISITVIVFAPIIIDVLKLPPLGVRVFRLTCLGALFHVLLLINILMQMYFDLRRQALATSLVFLLLNGGLAWWSVTRGVETFGVGYATASFFSLLFGFLLLHRSLDRLDYHTFTSQPIGSQEERREAAALAAEEKAREEAEAAEEEKEKEGAGTAAAPVADLPAEVTIAAGEMGTIVDADATPVPAAEVAPEEAEHAAEVPATDPAPVVADAAETMLELATDADEAAAVTDTDVGVVMVSPHDPAPPDAVTATDPAAPVRERSPHDPAAAEAAAATDPDAPARPVAKPKADVEVEAAAELTATDVQPVRRAPAPAAPVEVAADATATDVQPSRRAPPAAREPEAAPPPPPPEDVTATDVFQTTRRHAEEAAAEVEALAKDAEETATDVFSRGLEEIATAAEHLERVRGPDEPAAPAEPPAAADGDEEPAPRAPVHVELGVPAQMGDETAHPQEDTRTEFGEVPPHPRPRPRKKKEERPNDDETVAD